MKREGQIWIETVLYTLIGLALIGLILAIVMPKINESRDRVVVEQAIESLSIWDEKIGEVSGQVQGNVRNIPAFTMKEGELLIDSPADSVILTMKGLHKPYSEIGVPIRVGEVELLSVEHQGENRVMLALNYSGVVNITYNGFDEPESFVASPTPYSFSIKNIGGENLVGIDLKETSRG